MPFNFKNTEIPSVLTVESKKFADERGYFLETFKRSEAEKAGLPGEFSQDNFSFSKEFVLRGLHYQLPPFAQGKFVRCVQGKVWDAAVDIRKSSKTFKQWIGVELSAENSLAFYIPEGFAHGFVVLSEGAYMLYKTTREYNPAAERGINWNDPELNIKWPIKNPVLAPRDANFPFLKDAEIFS